jgi:hypothetical protein
VSNLRGLIAAAVLAVTAVGSCVGGLWATANASGPASAQADTVPCPGRAPPAGGDRRVIVVVLENHSYDQIKGSSPYLNQLAQRCALAINYAAVTHPSLPNYLALTSGDTDGIHSDCTSCSTRARSIFEQLGGHWRSYLESMPTPGYQGAAAGLYAKKHNPASYYTRLAASYKDNAVPLGSPSHGSLARDLKTNTYPRFSLIIPNLCNDEHDCPISIGDQYLQEWIPKILASRSYRSGKTVLFITYDEGISTSNHVYTVAASRSIRPKTIIRRPLDHYSLLRTSEQLLGLPCLAHACNSASMIAHIN